MSKIRYGVLNPAVRPVSDTQYFTELIALARRAKTRLWCTVFIVDLHPSRDTDLLVNRVLHELSAAKWRGVDVRLIIGGSRSNLTIAELSQMAAERARQLDIPVRWLTGSRVRGSHVKMVVSESEVLLGSHNWSAGAFTGQTQDSVLMQSPALCGYLASRFLNQWERRPEGENV